MWWNEATLGWARPAFTLIQGESHWARFGAWRIEQEPISISGTVMCCSNPIRCTCNRLAWIPGGGKMALA